MRTYDVTTGLRLSQSALPEMRARLALLDDAISALQSYQDQEGGDTGDTAAAADAGLQTGGPRPFLVARRDVAREKAS